MYFSKIFSTTFYATLFETRAEKHRIKESNENHQSTRRVKAELKKTIYCVHVIQEPQSKNEIRIMSHVHHRLMAAVKKDRKIS